ncbi:MAG: NUDIX hydrolase [Bifidobacterium mongoliense]|nr:NUDIX domain-containing protein [Bifidobacterium mongoliense]MDN6025698.1 NUDIX hydrolase [Bifidobacterium mongoliense]MDN6051904.1 NUDIX hydrolase [Bifidobacterium mongoliense]MDN6720514.1 NUDIX hydrolase [Bifidobacterium mongoliense]
MGEGNVSERRQGPPDVGVSVVILAMSRTAGARAADGEPSGTSQRSPTASRCGRQELWLPLVRRVREPFLGRWALPGGPLRANRSLEQSAYEALASATALRPRYLEQLHTFGDPGRSAGGPPMVSIVYWALVDPWEGAALYEDDQVAWFPEHRLPAMAFDHRSIIDAALCRLRSSIDYPVVVTRLVSSEFTLAQLHGVYEAVSDQDIDLANFRRRMLASGQLEDTGRTCRSGRRRPAAIYRYAPTPATGADGAEGPQGVTRPAQFAALRDGAYPSRSSGVPGHDDPMIPLLPGSAAASVRLLRSIAYPSNRKDRS